MSLHIYTHTSKVHVARQANRALNENTKVKRMKKTKGGHKSEVDSTQKVLTKTEFRCSVHRSNASCVKARRTAQFYFS